MTEAVLIRIVVKWIVPIVSGDVSRELLLVWNVAHFGVCMCRLVGSAEDRRWAELVVRRLRERRGGCRGSLVVWSS